MNAPPRRANNSASLISSRQGFGPALPHRDSLRSQKKSAEATFVIPSFIVLLALLTGCAGAPTPPRQIHEYQRHNAVGLEKYADGQVSEARNAFQRALARAELDDDGRLIASALLNLGATELLLDNANDAGRAYGRASREARLVKDAGLDWQAISGLAEATRRLGQPAKALELLASRPDLGKALDDAVRLPSEVSRARMLADQGQAGAALQLIEQVVEQATKRPPPDPILATALHARATLLLAAGQKKEAAAAAQAALEIDRALHHPPSVADDHRLLGQIATAQNDTEKARHHTRRAINIFANTGQDRRVAQAREALLVLPAEQQ